MLSLQNSDSRDEVKQNTGEAESLPATKTKEEQHMTTFEYFKAEYDKIHDLLIKVINPEVEVDSYRFVEIAWKHLFGGTCKVDKWYNIEGTNDCEEMFKAGYLKKWDDTRWEARMRGTTQHVALTKKGLKAFYKATFQKVEA